MTQEALLEAVNFFDVPGKPVAARQFGSGHINDTYEIEFEDRGERVKYVLQRVNTSIFRNPDGLMENIDRVTSHLRRKFAEKKSGMTTPEFFHTKSGDMLAKLPTGAYRLYRFIDGVRTFDVIENSAQAREGALAFGRFAADLADLPGKRLNETIPDFHNTPKRLATLRRAIEADACGRVKETAREIEFIMNRERDCSRLLDMAAAGEFPERITHNDTKLNNVLISESTGRGVAVIDLDTVMPGLVHYDFGDMVRTGASPAAEDELDLTKVGLQLNLFSALLQGYLAGAGSVFTKSEREELVFAGKLITLETGIRFLTDYLEGDVYFKIHRPGHNLDRTRTQLKLVASIEDQFNQMYEVLKGC
ncbi:MAG: aminoglycoside phosphotransferase family protein [Victivallaceae bacterium]|nr:aminoglycoside phosphotransferase family protein [Victivallaceae bacterium]